MPQTAATEETFDVTFTSSTLDAKGVQHQRSVKAKLHLVTKQFDTSLVFWGGLLECDQPMECLIPSGCKEGFVHLPDGRAGGVYVVQTMSQIASNKHRSLAIVTGKTMFPA